MIFRTNLAQMRWGVWWCLLMGLPQEVNTGSLYKGFDFPHPHTIILKLYKDLGGEIITIGSDAHKPQYLGYGFDKAEAILKQCGFDSYTVFHGGKPQQLKF